MHEYTVRHIEDKNYKKRYLEPKYKLDPPKMAEDQSPHSILPRPEK